jgi:glycerol-3-phosphate dehydrogenase
VVDHAKEDGAKGLFTVIAAKLTTARGTAEHAVDRIARALEVKAAPSRSATTPLPRARPLEGPLADRARVAAREEMALTLSDAVLRRLDLGTAGEPDPADVATVAQAMAPELGWDPARVEAERAALAAFYAARRL